MEMSDGFLVGTLGNKHHRAHSLVQGQHVGR